MFGIIPTWPINNNGVGTRGLVHILIPCLIVTVKKFADCLILSFTSYCLPDG